jgi:hypothetical protein
MTVAVRVSATVTGHRRRGVREHDLVLELPPGRISARQLIEAAVSAEVAAYQARAEEAALVRVLTDKSLAGDLALGAVRAGGPRDAGPGAAAPARADVSGAVQTALIAFEDGIFKVFIGDDELADDGDADLSDGAALLFLRLVPLAGG